MDISNSFLSVRSETASIQTDLCYYRSLRYVGHVPGWFLRWLRIVKISRIPSLLMITRNINSESDGNHDPSQNSRKLAPLKVMITPSIKRQRQGCNICIICGIWWHITTFQDSAGLDSGLDGSWKSGGFQDPLDIRVNLPGERFCFCKRKIHDFSRKIHCKN